MRFMKIVAIIGSYRKGMIIDNAVTQIIKGAESCGAEIEKIYLRETMIEFCRNCRNCTTDESDSIRARCVINDQMAGVLDKIDASDGIILASPVNFGQVTAIMKRFIERLAVYAKWKMDGKVRPPTKRIKKLTKRAILVTSSTMPAFLGRIMAPGVFGIMKGSAELVGAKVVQKLWFGMLPSRIDMKLSDKALKRAYQAGKKFVI